MLALNFGIEAADRFLDRQRGVDRPGSMVFKRDRGAKQRHHSVAEITVYRSFVPVHRVRGQLEHSVHEQVQLFCIELLGECRGIGDVGKHNGNEFALAFECAAGGQNVFRQITRCIGLRCPLLVKTPCTLPLGGLDHALLASESSSAFVAEFGQRAIGVAARGTADRQGCAAPVAKSGLFPILVLALDTLHAFAPPWPQPTAR